MKYSASSSFFVIGEEDLLVIDSLKKEANGIKRPIKRSLKYGLVAHQPKDIYAKGNQGQLYYSGPGSLAKGQIFLIS